MSSTDGSATSLWDRLKAAITQVLAPAPPVTPDPDPTPPSSGGGATPPPSIIDTLLEAIRDLLEPSDLAVGRLLSQASFGASPASIEEVKSKGLAGWVDAQLAMPVTTTYLDAYDLRWRDVNNAFPLNEPGQLQNDFYGVWWKRAVNDPDQLRHRVAFALSQIFVVSFNEPDLASSGSIRTSVAYYDVLYRNAFGDYRTLLDEVTRSPAMGIYLSHLGNSKEDANGVRTPDENYAREVMQLFSIGLWKLNADGTVALGADDQPIATYSSEDVSGLAKVFTGLSWSGLAKVPNDRTFAARAVATGASATSPMEIYDSRHSTSEKRFLGTVIPASATPDTAGDLKIALDAIANHPNVGPFISRQLIQRLVTSNPSPAYVKRVAEVFANDGAGKRGNLKAVVRTILLDREARDAARGDSRVYGKLREPVIRTAHLIRSFSGQSMNGLWQNVRTSALGQEPLTAPSVFNFWRPGFVPGGATKLGGQAITAPEFQAMTSLTNAEWANHVASAVATAVPGTDVKLDLSREIAIAGDSAALVERVAMLLLGGRISSGLRSATIRAVESVALPNAGDTSAARANRARLAILVIATSPEYVVQR